MSRVTPASNSLISWRRSKGNLLSTDPRTGGHRPKDRSSGGISPGVRGYFFTLTWTIARWRSYADMGGMVVVCSAWYVLAWMYFDISSSRSVSLSSSLLPTSPRLLRYGGTTFHALVSCLCLFPIVTKCVKTCVTKCVYTCVTKCVCRIGRARFARLPLLASLAHFLIG